MFDSHEWNPQTVAAVGESMRLLVHAKNVTGWGAVQVVRSFLESLHSQRNPLLEVTIALPSFGGLTELVDKFPRFSFLESRKPMFRRASRFLDCMFPGVDRASYDGVITFGDVPIRTVVPQVVLMHRPGLLDPELTFDHVEDKVAGLMRRLVSINARFADRVIVQTPWMAEGIASTYPEFKDRITVCRQPVPAAFDSCSREKIPNGSQATGLNLLYPAGYYPYKNHSLLAETSLHEGFSELVEGLVLTIEEGQTEFVYGESVSLVGYLPPERLKKYYRDSDAIVFPSLAESYGLPLIEGMVSNKAIVAADLPYARDACGENAIYFDPNSSESLFDAIVQLNEKLKSGWQPDWSEQLSRLPDSWDEVVDQFLGLFAEASE